MVFGKACLILDCMLDREETYEIYIVDLDDSDGDIYPALRVLHHSHLRDAFCVYNGSLYIFEASNGTPTKSVFKVELSTLNNIDNDNSIKHKNELTKIGEMSYPKMDPIAIPTPDGKKILVFSGLIDFDESLSPDGELYDLETQTWETIPEAAFDLCSWSLESFATIASYDFVSETKLLIQTSERDSFFLDLKEKRWVENKNEDLKGIGRGITGCYFRVEQFVFTTGRAFDYRRFIQNEEPESVFMPKPREDSKGWGYSGIAQLNHDKGEGKCNFALCLTNNKELEWERLQDWYIKVTIDVCCAHLQTDKIEIENVKSLDLCVRKFFESSLPYGFFSF